MNGRAAYFLLWTFLLLLAAASTGCVPVYFPAAGTVITVDQKSQAPLMFGMRECSAYTTADTSRITAWGLMPNEEKSELWWVPMFAAVDPVFDFHRELTVTANDSSNGSGTQNCSIVLTFESWGHMPPPILGDQKELRFEGQAHCQIKRSFGKITMDLQRVRMVCTQGTAEPIQVTGRVSGTVRR